MKHKRTTPQQIAAKTFAGREETMARAHKEQIAWRSGKSQKRRLAEHRGAKYHSEHETD
jgi:hypothetical protein